MTLATRCDIKNAGLLKYLSSLYCACCIVMLIVITTKLVYTNNTKYLLIYTKITIDVMYSKTNLLWNDTVSF